jgi:hypothetical protein
MRPASAATLILTALLFAFASTAFAQVNVRTLGGGRLTPNGPDAGFVDGNTLQSSQFRVPSGLAVDAAGMVYIADRNNGALRKLDVAGNRASTLVTGLNQPVAVAVDSTNNIYVLTQGDGLILRVDRFGNLSTNRARLLQPTALALGSSNAIYVTEAGGNVVRVINEARVPLRAGLNRPSGLALLESGLLAVSDTDNHRILFLNPENGNTILQIGTGVAGFRDGPIDSARFNQPHQLARTPGGSLLVADRGNHRLRSINTDGTVTTVYGVDPKSWEGPECVTCNPIILPGWFDGSTEFAEAREPLGVAVSRDGAVFTTEVFYHLVRQVTGLTLTSGSVGTGGTGGTGTDARALPPILIPDSGYFPLGQSITVLNPNTNALFANTIYYTTDGSIPTTNSLRLALSNNVGVISWRETTRDLTSLRLVSFVGGTASDVISGQAATTNEIGVTRDIAAGIGSTLVVPVTVNLRPGDQLKSLQFRVEVTPTLNSTPMIPEKFRALSVSSNDFIRVVTSSESGGSSTFSAASYANGLARGLTVTFIGTNASFSINNFAVVAMIAVPIPATAPLGARYTISVLSPSGTSDGAEASVPLRSMSPREIVVTNVSYLVGDSSPATWYNSDQIGRFGFGDGGLNNSDVNNAFAASLGLRVPYPFSDLFDALDVYPEDTDAGAGGDGFIRFLDWQVILRRSIGLDPARWRRTWSVGGVRVASRDSGSLPNLPAQTMSGIGLGVVWHPQAAVGALSIENAQPNVTVEMPVYVSVAAGYRLAGLAFRATVEPEGSAPPLLRPVEFVPATGVPTPIQGLGPGSNTLLCGWPIVPASSFNPSLQNSNILGSVRFTVPYNALPGQAYTLRFANADGSPDLKTQYDFETWPGSVWVQSTALRKPETISDEWKNHFFGSATNVSASADPDQDGSPNWMEYLAGTDPTKGQSSLRLLAPQFDAAKTGVVLQWLSAPGKMYTLETSLQPAGTSWTALATNLAGDGLIRQWTNTTAGTQTRFYRLRLQP